MRSEIECSGCLLPIAFNVKEAKNRAWKVAVKKFRKDMEKKDKRGLKLKNYFIKNFKDKFILDHCFEPLVVGHLVLQPVEHVTQLHEPSDKSTNKTHIAMSESDAKELISIARRVSNLLEECLCKQDFNSPPEKIYLCYFNEAQDWHLHFHIIPRARQEVIVGPPLMISDRRKITSDEVKKVVKCLKEKLSTC